jgi:ribose transport system ATP-binding protein
MNRVRGPRLVVDAVRKSFGATHALEGASLTVDAGEVHALLGENGAGKSTLLAILAGATTADAGSVTLDGHAFAPHTPAEARTAGVVMVHQELSLCPHMTVAENVFLGDEPSRFGIVSARVQTDRARRALERVAGASRLDPDQRVDSLSPADQQLVEIARAVARDSCRLLVLDEPTSSLTAMDAARLLGLVRSLAASGVAVLYVSHFLEEVRAVASRYTVLRDGRSVASGSVADTSTEELISAIAGRKVDQRSARVARPSGEVALAVRGVVVERSAGRAVTASFDLCRGEVLGLAGLVGAGRTELTRAIFGLDRVSRGEVRVGTLGGAPSPVRSLARGVGMLSEDRKREGLALGLSIADNVTMSRAPAVSSPVGRAKVAARWIAELGIRASEPDQRASELSGGNQQKVALARLLNHDVDVLLLDEPTRGVDVASKEQIYALIDALAARGKAILVVSSYVPELLALCDRIAVMHRGELGEARPTKSWTEHALIAAAAGA